MGCYNSTESQDPGTKSSVNQQEQTQQQNVSNHHQQNKDEKTSKQPQKNEEQIQLTNGPREQKENGQQNDNHKLQVTNQCGIETESSFEGTTEEETQIGINPLGVIPDDCICHIFTFLELKDQIRCTGTCKEFNRLIKRTWDWTHQTLAVEFIRTRESKRRELVRKYYILQIKKMQEAGLPRIEIATHWKQISGTITGRSRHYLSYEGSWKLHQLVEAS